jgi:hypothetical protein
MKLVPSNFWEWTAALQSEQRAALIFAGIVAVVFAIAILAMTIHSMHRNRLEVSLKREMLDRGMTADEIATIMARTPNSKRCNTLRPLTPIES